MRKDDNCPGKETSSTHLFIVSFLQVPKDKGRAYTGDCTTDDERDRSRSCGRDQAANFKDEDGAEEYPFDVEIPIDDTIHGLQTSSCE